MSNSAEHNAGSVTGASNPTLDYWAQVYATTQSEAMKQKAALILGIKEKK